MNGMFQKIAQVGATGLAILLAIAPVSAFAQVGGVYSPFAGTTRNSQPGTPYGPVPQGELVPFAGGVIYAPFADQTAGYSYYGPATTSSGYPVGPYTNIGGANVYTPFADNTRYSTQRQVVVTPGQPVGQVPRCFCPWTAGNTCSCNQVPNQPYPTPYQYNTGVYAPFSNRTVNNDIIGWDRALPLPGYPTPSPRPGCNTHGTFSPFCNPQPTPTYNPYPTPRPVPTIAPPGPAPTFNPPSPVPCFGFFCHGPADTVYTFMGDSVAAGASGFPKYADIFEDTLEERNNTEIDSRNLSRSGWHSSHLAAALQQDPLFQQNVAESDVITWNIGGNDLRIAREQYYRGECGGSDNQQCLRQAVNSFKANWNVIVEEVNARKKPGAVVRTMDLYNPYIAEDMAQGTFQTLQPYFNQVNSHIRQSGVPYARVHEAFNGPNGLTDPADVDFISADGYHPNSAGHRVIAGELIELGTSLP